MKINKEFILKNLITICCALSVLFLLLPFASAKMEVNTSFVGNISSSASVSGFDTIFGEGSTVVAWIMILCPGVLVAMNYVKQLDKYKSILAICLPVLSIIAAIITLLTAGAGASAAGASANVSLSPSIGFFLVVIAYIGTLIAGAMTFHGLKLSKEGLAEFSNKMKEEGLAGVDTLKNLTKRDGAEVNKTETSKVSIASSATAKKTNVNQADSVLNLIKQLADLKEQGILTEEEFSAKKRELLEQI